MQKIAAYYNTEQLVRYILIAVIVALADYFFPQEHNILLFPILMLSILVSFAIEKIDPLKRYLLAKGRNPQEIQAGKAAFRKFSRGFGKFGLLYILLALGLYLLKIQLFEYLTTYYPHTWAAKLITAHPFAANLSSLFLIIGVCSYFSTYLSLKQHFKQEMPSEMWFIS